LTATLTRSAGEAGRAVEEQICQFNRRLRKLATFGVESHIRSELVEAFYECSKPDWDGYDALPVTYDSFQLAEKFLLAIPLGVPMPSVGAEPDGQLTLEWSIGVRRTLSISFDPCGELHYAALIGPGRMCGTEPFIDAVPATILNLIKEVC